MPIPMLDISKHHAPIESEIEEAVLRVLRSGRYILGPELEGFESELADSVGVSNAIALSSGTDALLEAFMALGVGPGTEVVLPPFTFFATAGVVARLGGKPVFADIDPKTFNLDPEKALAAITPRTKALQPVHLFGQTADLSSFEEISTRSGVPVVEDACQAIGAAWCGRKAGSVGLMGCFSFFPSKNLGAAGDAGAITTNDDELAKRLRALRMHGESSRYHHDEVGGNFRMDALQAAILRVKLPHLSGWEEGRRRNAGNYRKLFAAAGLAGEPVVLPTESPGAHHVYNQFVVRVPQREGLMKALSGAGIGNAIYYPVPLHLQECFRYLGHREGDFPFAEQACQEVLALPVFPEMSLNQQEEVVAVIHTFYGRGGA